jgi:DNA replication protein DnaC
MAEIFFLGYDLFVSRKLVTHLTTNFSASEIEGLYGNRVRSRMRELFNFISFDSHSIDKRR